MECPSFKRILEQPPLWSAKTHVGRRMRNEDRYLVNLEFIDLPLQPAGLEEIVPKTVSQLFPTQDPSQSSVSVPASSGQLNRIDPEYVLDTFHLFSVFDGHGGEDASTFLAENLGKYLKQELQSRLENCPKPQSFLRLKTVPPDVLLSNVQKAIRDLDLSDIPDDDEEDEDGEERPKSKHYIDSQEDGSRSSHPSDDLYAFCDDVHKRSKSPDCLSPGRRFPVSESLKEDSTGGMTSNMIKSALSKCMSGLDEDFGKVESSQDCGSTAVVALVSSVLLCVANIGDSRAVLFRRQKPYPLTRDHTPACPDEVDRVSDAGGHIVQMIYDGPRVMGVLNMTRAVGDHALRPYIIAAAEIAVLRRHESDEFMVIASDGLWGEMPVEDCCNLVQKCFSHGQAKGISRQAAVKLAANVLVRRVLEKGGADNVTVVVVDLKKEKRSS